MTSEQKEDRLIHQLYILVPTLLIAGFLATVAVVTVMISYNFNFLNWFE